MYKIYLVLIRMFIAIMVTLNGVLAGEMGDYKSVVIIQGIGFKTPLLIILIKRYSIKLSKEIPFYLYTSGIVGVTLVVFNNISIARLGVTLTLSLALLGQAASSLVVDHFGLFRMSVSKINPYKIISLLSVVL